MSSYFEKVEFEREILITINNIYQKPYIDSLTNESIHRWLKKKRERAVIGSMLRMISKKYGYTMIDSNDLQKFEYKASDLKNVIQKIKEIYNNPTTAST